MDVSFWLDRTTKLPRGVRYYSNVFEIDKGARIIVKWMLLLKLHCDIYHVANDSRNMIWSTLLHTVIHLHNTPTRDLPKLLFLYMNDFRLFLEQINL